MHRNHGFHSECCQLTNYYIAYLNSKIINETSGSVVRAVSTVHPRKFRSTDIERKMTFKQAFLEHIANRRVILWGFQQPVRVILPNGYSATPCGYFTEYDNGYRVIASGASLGGTAIQEIMLLDPDGIPIARDTEDLSDVE